jgi:hypothetical protein
MDAGWIEHLPWLYALAATLAGLELLRRLRQAKAANRDLTQERDRVNLSLDLAQAIGRMGSWQYARTETSAFWSDEVFAIHGRDRQRGQPLIAEAISYFHPDDRVTIANAVQRSLDFGEDFDLRGRIITDAGELKEILIRSTCRYDRDGTTLGVIGFIIDLGPPD